MSQSLEEMMELQNRITRERNVLMPLKGKVVGDRKMMPTFSALIERFSYKPGYELTLVHPDIPDWVYQAPEGRASQLFLKCYVPNAWSPTHEPYLLRFTGLIPHYLEHREEAYQFYHLKQLLEVFELHERDEWMWLDGKVVEDPHKHG